MSNTNVLLPTICLVALYICRNLYACLIKIDPYFSGHAVDDLEGHIAGVLFSALVFTALPYLFRKFKHNWLISGRLAGIPHLGWLASAMVFLAGLGSFAFYLGYTHLGAPPVSYFFVAFALGVFWPILMLLFFGQIPPYRQGLYFGVGVAAGECAWLMIMPFLALGGSPDQILADVLQLRKILAFLNLLLGAFLGYALLNSLKQSAPDQDFPLQTMYRRISPCPPDKTKRGQVLILVLLMFLAVCLYLGGIGLVLGNGFIKANYGRHLPGFLQYMLLAGAPLTGFILDRGRKGFYLVAAILVPSVFLIPLTQNFGLTENRFVLFTFYACRESVFLIFMLLTVRLCMTAWSSFTLPAVAGLAYMYYFASFWGNAVGHTALGPQGKLVLTWGVTLVVAGIFAYLLKKLHGYAPLRMYAFEARAATESEPLLAVGKPNIPDKMPQYSLDKQSQFNACFNLTRRETQIFDGLLKGMDLEAIARTLEISERTARFHLTGLLKKTGVQNRQRLLNYYAAWRARD